MIPIFKYNHPEFDRAKAWSDRYRTMYASEKSMEEYESQSFWPELQKRLAKDELYLDAGCGIGGWILFLRDAGFSVEGVDPHAAAVRAMSEYDPDLVVKIAHISEIPYQDGKFDGVVSIGSLEYEEGQVHASIQEISRVVRPGGFVCMEVPLMNTLRRILYVPLKRLEGLIRKVTGRTAVFAYYLFDKKELATMLEDAGFSIEHMAPHDLPGFKSHFGLYANWPFLRGDKPYELNIFGRIVQAVCNTLSPWIASAGVVVIATRQSSRRR